MDNGIRVVRDGSCPSLSGKSTLTYEVGTGPAADIHLRVRKNTGSGYFSADWVAWEALLSTKIKTSTWLATSK